MSSHQQAGRWEPADEIDVRAIMGEVTLDFTRAELPPSGMVDVHADVIMGEVHIIVPNGAEIELDATPFLGSVECIDRSVKLIGMLDRVRDRADSLFLKRRRAAIPELGFADDPVVGDR